MDLNLHQRTIVILGPVKSTLQNVVMMLAQHGADVGIVDPDGHQLQRFCQNISDQREINDKFGRAMAVSADFSSWSSVKEAMGKVAQSFGSIDMLIDGMYSHQATPFQISGDENSLDLILTQNLSISLKASQFAAGFMKGRRRGRIIYLMSETFQRGVIEDAVATAARTGLIRFARTLSNQLQDFNVTANCLSLGLTEEYLLAHFPECKTMTEALEKMKLLLPLSKASNTEKIGNSIIYLCSSAGVAVSGQHLTLS